MILVIFPLLIFQSWLATAQSQIKYNTICINTTVVIALYSICFLALLFEKSEIKDAIRVLIYISCSAIVPYVLFFNTSIAYLYTEKIDNNAINHTLLLTAIVYLTTTITALRKINKEINIKSIIKNEFLINENFIIMRNPYKRDYWFKNKNFIFNFIKYTLSLIPILFYIKTSTTHIGTKTLIVSIASILFSIHIHTVIVKIIYIYFYIPVYLCLKNSKKIIFISK